MFQNLANCYKVPQQDWRAIFTGTIHIDGAAARPVHSSPSGCLILIGNRACIGVEDILFAGYK